MGILTSSKRLTVRSTADMETVISSLMDGVRRDSLSRIFARQFTGASEIVGYIEGDVIRLQHKSNMRNSLRATMVIHVSEAHHGGTIVQTHYSTSLAVKAFLILWLSLALVMSTTMTFVYHFFPSLLFPFFGLIVLAIMRVFSRIDESKLEEFVHSRVERAEYSSESEEPSKMHSTSRSVLRALKHVDG